MAAITGASVVGWDVPPPPKSEPITEVNWQPRLNPTQQKVFDSLAKYVLAFGEKGSGKSIGGLNSLVRHCFEEDEALALIIAPQIRTGKEGVMYDLGWVLDIWKNGNWDQTDPDHNRRLDDGIDGFEYTEPSLDPQTKDRVLYIKNQHGSWSKVILMSIPYAEVVEKRMKSLSPSFIYVDEITELDSQEFFTYVAQQLGRRRGIKGPMQYVASCNPEGPTHWVYKVWWTDCIDKETGKRDPDFEAHHVPVAENYDNLPAGYVEGLKKLYKDPTDAARLLEGRWVDRPSGDAIFKDSFREDIHVRGTLEKSLFLTPKPGVPIIVSYDPGPRNYCITFEQMIPTKEKTIWIAFDEINNVGEFARDEQIVGKIIDRVVYWRDWMRNKHKTGVSFVHILPEDAFSHLRHDGTYDATRLRDISKEISKKRGINPPIEIRPRKVMQPADSVPQRVQMVQNLLYNDALFISVMCPRTIEMFRLLVSEKAKKDKYDRYQGLKPHRSPYLHPFDALSHGPYYFTLNPAMFALQTAQASDSMVFRAGSG